MLSPGQIAAWAVILFIVVWIVSIKLQEAQELPAIEVRHEN